MKRILTAAVLLTVLVLFPEPASARHGVKRYLTKESTADFSQSHKIFVGWVDLGPDQWTAYGYNTKAEWTEIIAGLNAQFISSLPAMYLPGYTIVGAKDAADQNATGYDLYVKFSDVYVDYDNYHLILSIHFIDPKTNAEIAVIPVRPYFGDNWGLRGYLNYALKEVATKMQVEVTGTYKKVK